MWEGGTEEDRIRIRRIGASLGLGRKFLSKDMVLSTLLKAIGDQIGPEYIIKGGTLISRAGYMKTPRFSEDVDLEYFGPGNIKDATDRCLDWLSEIPGFELERPRHQGRSHRIDARFVNHWGERDRIRVEFSELWLSPEGSTKPPSQDETPKTMLQSPFTEGPAALMKAYSGPHLFVMKLDALSDRMEGKDPFDLWGMWNRGMDRQRVDEVLRTHDWGEMGAGGMLAAASSNIDDMFSDTRNISNSTGHYIPKAARPDWTLLLKDVKAIIRSFQE